jgi:prenyl protein peptidase
MQPSPIISSFSALLITHSFALVYVGSLYMSKNTRFSFVSKPDRAEPGREDEERKKMKRERWGDDPEVIKARLAAVSVATVVCCLGVFAVLFYFVGGTANVY